MNVLKKSSILRSFALALLIVSFSSSCGISTSDSPTYTQIPAGFYTTDGLLTLMKVDNTSKGKAHYFIDEIMPELIVEADYDSLGSVSILSFSSVGDPYSGVTNDSTFGENTMDVSYELETIKENGFTVRRMGVVRESGKELQSINQTLEFKRIDLAQFAGKYYIAYATYTSNKIKEIDTFSFDEFGEKTLGVRPFDGMNRSSMLAKQDPSNRLEDPIEVLDRLSHQATTIGSRIGTRQFKSQLEELKKYSKKVAQEQHDLIDEKESLENLTQIIGDLGYTAIGFVDIKEPKKLAREIYDKHIKKVNEIAHQTVLKFIRSGIQFILEGTKEVIDIDQSSDPRIQSIKDYYVDRYKDSRILEGYKVAIIEDMGGTLDRTFFDANIGGKNNQMLGGFFMPTNLEDEQVGITAQVSSEDYEHATFKQQLDVSGLVFGLNQTASNLVSKAISIAFGSEHVVFVSASVWENKIAPIGGESIVVHELRHLIDYDQKLISFHPSDMAQEKLEIANKARKSRAFARYYKQQKTVEPYASQYKEFIDQTVLILSDRGNGRTSKSTYKRNAIQTYYRIFEQHWEYVYTYYESEAEKRAYREQVGYLKTKLDSPKEMLEQFDSLMDSIQESQGSEDLTHRLKSGKLIRLKAPRFFYRDEYFTNHWNHQ